MRGALQGKSLGRILFNNAIRVYCENLSGHVLDVAGGATPSHLPYLPQSIDLVRTDLRAAPGVIALDMNTPLPFPDGSFDAVLCFNALYIADDPTALAREVHRILRKGGAWYVSSPFIANEMPEPHDYRRLTAEGLEKVFQGARFTSTDIHRIGERGSAAAGILNPFFIFNVVRALLYPAALFFDWLVPARVRREHPTPIGYFCIAIK